MCGLSAGYTGAPGAGGGSYVPPAYDWITVDGALGAGSPAAIDIADFPDLSTQEGGTPGQALASYTQVADTWARLRPATNNTQVAGILLGTMPDGVDSAAAVRLAFSVRGVLGNTAVTWSAGLYVFDGVNTIANSYTGPILVGQFGDTLATRTVAQLSNTLGGRGVFSSSFAVDYGAPRVGAIVDLAVERIVSGANSTITGMMGRKIGWTQAPGAQETTYGTNPMKVALMIHSGTAGLELDVDVLNIAKPENFTALPRVA